MWRSLFLSITSLGALAACSGGDECGSSGAVNFGISASSNVVTLTYGDLTAGANNDCPDPMAPSGVVSLTIMGTQMGSTTGLITLCIPRPDLLEKGSLTLGTEVQLIDVSGMDAMCSYNLDTSVPASGTAQGLHMCGNGTDKSGFQLEVNGGISLMRTCGSTVDTTQVTLRGTGAVKAM